MNFTGTDSLFYDFKINVGDTLRFQACIGTVVTAVDSVQIGISYRKRFSRDNSSAIIEGVGNTAGPFDELCGAPCVCPYFWSLVCFSLNNVTLYPDTNPCITLNSIHEPEHPLAINIFPNPTPSHFTITSPVNLDQLEITNALGQVVYRATPKDKRAEVRMNREGIYFVRVRAGEEWVVRKVMVEK